MFFVIENLNYLAHAYLSFGDKQILAGNMISDFIKGKKKYSLPERILKGVDLHRAIDEFTDNNPATAKAKLFFKPTYGLYAAPFIDIVYDHFLATDKNIFSANELETFASSTYADLKGSEMYFPEIFNGVFYYMQKHNWLLNYQYTEGIFRSFNGLVRRAKYMSDPRPACDILMKYYNELKNCYEVFFPAVLEFSKTQFSQLDR